MKQKLNNKTQKPTTKNNKNQTTKINNNEQNAQQEPSPTVQIQNNSQEILDETTIMPEKNPLPTTQLPEEIFTSQSVVTNNRYQLLENTRNLQDIITPETTPTTKESNSDNLTTPETTPISNEIDSNNPIPTSTKHFKKTRNRRNTSKR